MNLVDFRWNFSKADVAKLFSLATFFFVKFFSQLLTRWSFDKLFKTKTNLFALELSRSFHASLHASNLLNIVKK